MSPKKEIIRAVLNTRALPIDKFGGFTTAGRSRKLVFMTLASYANPDGTNACPSYPTLAKECGYKSESGVRNVVKWLEKNKLLVIYHKAGKDRNGKYLGTNRHDLIFESANSECQVEPAKTEGLPAKAEVQPANLETQPANLGIQPANPETTQPYRPQRPYIDRERESNPSFDKISRQVLVEISKAKGTISTKEQEAIIQLVKENDWTEKETVFATKAILSRLDTFEMKRAGNRILATLAAEIEMTRQETAKEVWQRELLEIATAQAQQEVARELAEPTEADLIEETL